jgi:hypothetical protein
VLQEFSSSKQVNFICGPKRLSLAEVDQLLYMLSIRGVWNDDESTFQTSLTNYFCKLRKADEYISSLKQGTLVIYFLTVRAFSISTPSRNYDVYNILKHVPLSQATDPRDLLYSKSGLLGFHYEFCIDYSTSNTISLVLTHFAQEIIKVDKDLRILYYACMLNTENDRAELPSWVPNWKEAINVTYGPGFRFEKLGKEIEFKRWPDFQCEFLINPKTSRTTTLRIRGRFMTKFEEHVESTKLLSFKLNIHTEVKFNVKNVLRGDELWLLNNASQGYILRKQNEGGYRLVYGVDFLMPTDSETVDESETDDDCESDDDYWEPHGRDFVYVNLSVSDDGLVYAEWSSSPTQIMRQPVSNVGEVQWIDIL